MPYNVESPWTAGLGAAAGFMAGQTEKKRKDAEAQRQAALDKQRAEQLATEQATAADERVYRRGRDTLADTRTAALDAQTALSNLITRREKGYDAEGKPLADPYSGKPQGQNLDSYFGITAEPTYADQARDMFAHAAALHKDGQHGPAAQLEATAREYMNLQQRQDTERDRIARDASTDKYRAAVLAGQEAGRTNTTRHQKVIERQGDQRIGQGQQRIDLHVTSPRDTGSSTTPQEDAVYAKAMAAKTPQAALKIVDDPRNGLTYKQRNAMRTAVKDQKPDKAATAGQQGFTAQSQALNGSTTWLQANLPMHIKVQIQGAVASQGIESTAGDLNVIAAGSKTINGITPEAAKNALKALGY